MPPEAKASCWAQGIWVILCMLPGCGWNSLRRAIDVPWLCSNISESKNIRKCIKFPALLSGHTFLALHIPKAAGPECERSLVASTSFKMNDNQISAYLASQVFLMVLQGSDRFVVQSNHSWLASCTFCPPTIQHDSFVASNTKAPGP